MTAVHVNIMNMGAAGAEVGAVRYNLRTGSVIVVHAGLALDEQAALVTELTRDGEMPVYVNVPAPRPTGETADPVLDRPSAVAARLRAVAAAASAVAVAGCAGPLAGG